MKIFFTNDELLFIVDAIARNRGRFLNDVEYDYHYHNEMHYINVMEKIENQLKKRLQKQRRFHLIERIKNHVKCPD